MEGAGMHAESRARVTGAQLPLSMVSEGEVVSVAKVRGAQDLRQHLAELGFVQGAEVRVVSRVGGDVVVNVKGATFGLNRDMAMKIVTC
jgi:ferrous iron transport protein A